MQVTVEKVFRWWDYAVFILLTVLALAAIAKFAVAWVRFDEVRYHPILFLLITMLLVPIVVNQQARWFLLLAMRRPCRLSPEPGLRVAVVTTYVPGAEPREMLEQSLAALVAIDYPHETWVLDEGADPEMRVLCKRLGVRYFTRHGRPEYQTFSGRLRSGSKHGNYNAWLDDVGFGRYDVLAAFDPDHVAHPEFLTHVLGYFRDPEVGYVQPAQAYYNQRASFIARGAAEETYAYYSSVQMAGYGIGYPIIVGGHNVHRMSALKAVGGFADHDADDLLLTLKYRAAGWQGIYVPLILAQGLVPVDWRGYLTQQRRWARSVMDIKLRRRSQYAPKLPMPSRILTFLHGINFLYRHVVAMFGLLIVQFELVWGGGDNAGFRDMLLPVVLLCGSLALEEVYRQRFYLNWRVEAGSHWRAAVLQYASWPWFILALCDVMARRRQPYVVTQKSKREELWLGFIAVQLAIALVIVLGLVTGIALGREASQLAMLAAGLIVLGHGALATTELRGFPPPWDVRLARIPGRTASGIVSDT